MNIKDIKKESGIVSATQSDDAPDSASMHPMIGKHCVIRTYSAGVHIGEVVDVDNKAGGHGSDVMLKNARRLYRWEGAFTLSEVATAGVKSSSRIAVEVPLMYITGAIEFIPCTKTALKTFEACHEK